jgi:5-methylthioadenosine/S-adenosylhomocysteine deaminase
MIDIMVAPHAIYTNAKESLRKALDIAKGYNKAINIHLSETSYEVESSYKENSMSPVKYLDEIGMFDVHTVAPHCVHVNDEDIKVLSNKNVSVAHNPSSNLKLSSGIAPIQKMIDAGINVAIGTDGASSNNNLDMIEEMHIAALIAKVYSNDPTALDAKTVIKMATINGAKALGIDNKVGSIEKGKQADLIMIDTKSPFSQPKREYLNNLVYSMGRNQVVMTMVAGKILQKDGKIFGLDMSTLNEQFNNCVDRLC